MLPILVKGLYRSLTAILAKTAFVIYVCTVGNHIFIDNVHLQRPQLSVYLSEYWQNTTSFGIMKTRLCSKGSSESQEVYCVCVNFGITWVSLGYIWVNFGNTWVNLGNIWLLFGDI